MQSKIPALKKQSGMTLIEMAIVIVLGAVVILGGMKIVPSIQFSMSSSELTREVNEIRTAVLNWKGSRPDFSGVSMDSVCGNGRRLLTESVCGSNSDGAGAVPWGGDYILSATPGDASKFNVTINTLPGERIFELGDGLAPITRDRCSYAGHPSCTSITVTGESLTPSSSGQLILTF